MKRLGDQGKDGERRRGSRTPSENGDEPNLSEYIIDIGDKPQDAGAHWADNRKRRVLAAALKPTASDAAKAKVKRRDGKALG